VIAEEGAGDGDVGAAAAHDRVAFFLAPHHPPVTPTQPTPEHERERERARERENTSKNESTIQREKGRHGERAVAERGW